jgi:hypothetical protein
MGAGSRFDQPLTLVHDGHQVVACGPLGFYGCEVRAEVTINLRQPGHGKARGHGVFTNAHHDPAKCEDEVGDDDDDEWMLSPCVNPEAVHEHLTSAMWSSFAFRPTPAYGGTAPLVIAHGVIVYLNQDGTQDIKPWVGDGAGHDMDARWQ